MVLRDLLDNAVKVAGDKPYCLLTNSSHIFTNPEYFSHVFYIKGLLLNLMVFLSILISMENKINFVKKFVDSYVQDS